jgi:outer membrane protein W
MKRFDLCLTLLAGLVVLAVLVALANPAHADEREPARAGIFSYERFYVRAGLLHMQPFTDSRELELSGVDGAASLALMDGPIAGSGAALEPVTIPAVIAGYVLPVWDDRVSLETVLATPIHVKFRATGTLRDMSIAPEALGIPTGVPALGSELGEADAAPPLVTAVYRVGALGPLLPYLGAGIAVLVTYNARATNPILTEVGEPKFHIDPAPGVVVQLGSDIAIWRSLHARIDLKYIAFMKAHATVDNLRVRTPELPLLEQAEVGSATMEMWVNPLILHVGLGVDL